MSETYENRAFSGKINSDSARDTSRRSDKALAHCVSSSNVKTLEQLLGRLASKGIAMEGTGTESALLESLGYTHVARYVPAHISIVDAPTFSMLYEDVVLDHEFQGILLSYIIRFERSFKSHLANALAGEFGEFAHMNQTIFKDAGAWKQFADGSRSEIIQKDRTVQVSWPKEIGARRSKDQRRTIAMGLFKSISFSSGGSIQLEDNSIVVLVGPNNAGKSQALKDIYSHCQNSAATKVVTSVDIELPPQNEIEDELANYSQVSDRGDWRDYSGIGYSFSSTSFYDIYNKNGHTITLKTLTPFLVSRLKTEERLGLVFPPNSIETNGGKEHPIHYLTDSPEVQERLSSYFERAFGIPLSVDILNGPNVPLRLGAVPNLEAFDTEKTMAAITEVKRVMGPKPMLHEQGDGMRSFVGILLDFLIEHRRAFLVDEPESFLHPPQAHILGQIFGELLGDERQCIVATHSRDLIQGLIETCPDRVLVVRVTRAGNANPINVLGSAQIAQLLSDPILKYSNIMDSMFHESVVLCESDSDCMMYSIVYSYLSKERGRLPQTQFIHCGGKTRMSVVVDALSALGIEFRVIPDLDILNDGNACRKLFTSCGGNWNDVKRDYTIATSAINQKGQKVMRIDMQDLLEKCNDRFLSKQEIKSINSLLVSGKPWSSVKRNGFDAFPGGDAHNAAFRLKQRFEEANIYLVPVGELESFNKASGKHGPQWVAEVLAMQPDLADSSYDSLRGFVTSWNL